MKFAALFPIIFIAGSFIVGNGEDAYGSAVLPFEQERKRKKHKKSCSCDDLERRLAALEQKVLTQQMEISSLLSKTTCIDGTSNADDLIFSGCNVHVVNGDASKSTNVTNGKGNLIVGFNERTVPDLDKPIDRVDADRRGSHNVVIGSAHAYKDHSGLVFGVANSISKGSMSGGRLNIASGNWSSVSGGYLNNATGDYSSISGGIGSIASGELSSISGGESNAASGVRSSISGGANNEAIGSRSSVSGGIFNAAGGDDSTISGSQGIECGSVAGLCPPDVPNPTSPPTSPPATKP